MLPLEQSNPLASAKTVLSLELPNTTSFPLVTTSCVMAELISLQSRKKAARGAPIVHFSSLVSLLTPAAKDSKTDRIPACSAYKSRSYNVVLSQPLQVISPNGTLHTNVETPVVCRSVRILYFVAPLKSSERISKIGRVRSLEDSLAFTSTRQTPLISTLGSVHISAVESSKGLTIEQIMKIITPCSITMGDSEADVVTSI